MNSSTTLGQFVRYVTVGLASNLVLYLGYLTLTAAGVGAKSAMTLLYAVGLAQSFVFNKRWSFRHGGSHGPAFVRYCTAYALGYLANLLGLMVLVDVLGFAHQLVQGAMVMVVAAMLFLLQKFWVFRGAGGRALRTG